VGAITLHLSNESIFALFFKEGAVRRRRVFSFPRMRRQISKTPVSRLRDCHPL